VTVQPLIQFLSAGLLCAACARKLTQARNISLSSSMWWTQGGDLLLCLVTLSLFWFVLPYGLQNQYKHGEGAARVSTTLLYAIAFLAWLHSPTKEWRYEGRAARLTISILVTALTTTFNPISAIVPAILLVLVFFGEFVTIILNRRSSETSTPMWWFPIPCLLGFLIVVGDPYYAETLRRVISSLLEPSTGGLTSSDTTIALALPTEPILPWLRPARVASFLFAGTLPHTWINVWLLIALSLMVLAWFTQDRRIATRYLVFMFALSLGYYAGLIIPHDGAAHMPLYLLQPYYLQSTLQIGAVAGLTLLVTFISTVVQSTPRISSYALSSILIWCVSTLSRSPAAANAAFSLSSRANYCGSLGCASASDHAALRFIRDIGNNILGTYKDLTYQTSPKILILGSPAILGREKWVFPYGASRLVPLHSPLPVVFFYGRGSPAWDFDNYRRHVCNRFDMEWMRRHNIRYLFIPSSGGGCLRKRDAVIASSTILFQEGDSIVLKLF